MVEAKEILEIQNSYREPLISLVAAVVGGILVIAGSWWMEKRRRKTQTKDFRKALIVELDELRIWAVKMATGSRGRKSSIDKAFLVWCSDHVKEFAGAGRDEETFELYEGISEFTDERISKFNTIIGDMLPPKKYYMRYTVAQMSLLPLLESSTQAAILDIVGIVDGTNEGVDIYRNELNRTFDPSLTETNLKTTKQNLDVCNEELRGSCETIADRAAEAIALLDKES